MAGDEHETEEIILKRQRNQVEMGRFLLKQAENRRDQSVKVDLPRREQDLRDSAAKAVINWEKSQSTLPLTLSQKRLALEKARYERAKGAERLANLKKDRELLTVKSPADGIVYYGRCVQGNWPTAAALLTKPPKGGNLSAEVRNIPPSLAGDMQIEVSKGGSVPITLQDLSALDPDDSAKDLRFSICNVRNGYLSLASAPRRSVTSFTQADLETGQVSFVHDGRGSGPAAFDIVVADRSGGTSGAPQTVRVAVRA